MGKSPDRSEQSSINGYDSVSSDYSLGQLTNTKKGEDAFLQFFHTNLSVPLEFGVDKGRVIKPYPRHFLIVGHPLQGDCNSDQNLDNITRAYYAPTIGSANAFSQSEVLHLHKDGTNLRFGNIRVQRKGERGMDARLDEKIIIFQTPEAKEKSGTLLRADFHHFERSVRAEYDSNGNFAYLRLGVSGVDSLNTHGAVYKLTRGSAKEEFLLSTITIENVGRFTLESNFPRGRHDYEIEVQEDDDHVTFIRWPKDRSLLDGNPWDSLTLPCHVTEEDLIRNLGLSYLTLAEDPTNMPPVDEVGNDIDAWRQRSLLRALGGAWDKNYPMAE